MGEIAVNGAEKAKSTLTSVASEGKRTSTSFREIGTAALNTFQTNARVLDKFSVSLERLTTRVTTQQNKVELLKQKYADLCLTQGKNSKEAKACATEIKSLSKELKENKEKLDKATSAADKFDKSLKDAGDEADKAEGKFSKLGATFAKIGAAAIAAAATGVAYLGKQALTAYADYEQLVGGVDTLFKESSAKVQEYAANAYKTAGLSANEYMETVTSFSASLLQSLGQDTEAAAKMADIAITDMSDNANKMGTDMTSIQNAYQGFAKQNYTMLDNLKLGYGGTKEEMERLIADANALNAAQGKYTSYSIDSFADIVSAIHDVQVQMEISGITAEEAAEMVASGAMTQEEAFAAMGTTAKEAATTIQGSVNSMKGAWKNLLVGIADENADFKSLTDQFVNSLVTVGTNIIPRVNTIIQGITKLVQEASQTIIPLAVQTLLKNLPDIISAGVDMILALVSGILDNADLLMDATIQCIEMMLEKIIENLPVILSGGTQLLVSLVNGIIGMIPFLVSMLPQVISAITMFLTENLPLLVEAGVQLIVALAGGLIEAIPVLVSSIPEIISAIVKGFDNSASRILEIGKNIARGVWEGIKSMASWLSDKVSGFFGGIVDGVKGFLGIASPSKVFAGIGKYMAEGLGEGWEDEFGSVKAKITGGLNFKAGKLAYAGADTRQSEATKKNVSSGGITIVQNISSVPQTPIQLAAATEAYFEQARWAL